MVEKLGIRTGTEWYLEILYIQNTWNVIRHPESVFCRTDCESLQVVATTNEVATVKSKVELHLFFKTKNDSNGNFINKFIHIITKQWR